MVVVVVVVGLAWKSVDNEGWLKSRELSWVASCARSPYVQIFQRIKRAEAAVLTLALVYVLDRIWWGIS